MSIYDASHQLKEVATTRRSIVKTGVKVAYAAPLVVATMKLTSAGAGAISGPQGSTVCSGSILDFGPNGWGGWSCPAGTKAVSGTHDLASITQAEVAQPGAPSGLYPAYPHYTFSPGETGYVVQNDNDGESGRQICVTCVPI